MASSLEGGLSWGARGGARSARRDAARRRRATETATEAATAGCAAPAPSDDRAGPGVRDPGPKVSIGTSAEELAHERVLRLPHLVDRALGDDPALLEQPDPVAGLERARAAVRDD